MDIDIKETVEKTVEDISRQVQSRAVRASNELRNSALNVLRGHRSGKVYKKPGTYGKRATKQTKELLKDYDHKLRGGQLYRASAPGEPPANRSEALRTHWEEKTISERRTNNTNVTAMISSDTKYAEALQEGTDDIAPRPFREPVIEKAKPRIQRIFKEPYI